MSLFENGKRSRVVLTGVVLGTGVVSVVNQSIVGADNTLGIPKSPSVGGDLLGKLADKGTKGSGLYSLLWKTIGVAVLAFVAGFIVYAVCKWSFSDEGTDTNIENNIVNTGDKGDYSLDGKFKEVFKEGGDQSLFVFEEKDLKKMRDLVGCVFNISKEELADICFEEEDKEELLANCEKYKRLDFVIDQVMVDGSFHFFPIDEQGKKLTNEGMYTKWSIEDKAKVNKLFKCLDSKKGVYFETMPFGKVFRYYEGKVDNYKENMKGWEEIENFEGCVYNISIKELRRMVSVGYRDNLEIGFNGCQGKIKIKIDQVCGDGSLYLSVLDEENKFLCSVATGYATTDADDLKELATYLAKNRVLGKTPFSEVFRMTNALSSAEMFGWGKEVQKFKDKSLYIDIEELRLFCPKNEQLDEFLEDNLNECDIRKISGKTEVKVKITKFYEDGELQISILGKGEQEGVIFDFDTRYAVRNAEKINKLVKYLEQQTMDEKNNEQNGNVIENNNN